LFFLLSFFDLPPLSNLSPLPYFLGYPFALRSNAPSFFFLPLPTFRTALPAAFFFPRFLPPQPLYFINQPSPLYRPESRLFFAMDKDPFVVIAIRPVFLQRPLPPPSSSRPPCLSSFLNESDFFLPAIQLVPVFLNPARRRKPSPTYDCTPRLRPLLQNTPSNPLRGRRSLMNV